MDLRTRGHVRFDAFDVNLGTGEVRKYGIRVPLQNQAFDVLAVLLENPGALVIREDLKERIWGRDTYIDFDQGLNKAIKKIRIALGDSAEQPKYIETLPKRGYRFIGPVALDGAIPSQNDPASLAKENLISADAAHAEAKPTSQKPFSNRLWLAIGIGTVLAIGVPLAFFLARGEPSQHTELKLRQLTRATAENFVANAVISPDGNYLLFGDPIGIHLRPLASQETRTFGIPAHISARAWIPVAWYPDQSRFIGVTAASTTSGLKVTSWVISVLSGAVALLREDAFAQSVSPDGSLVAFTAGGPLDQEIWVTGPHGEDARRVATTNDPGAFENVRWSPDSRRLAILRRKFNGKSPQQQWVIETCDSEGSPPTVLVSEQDSISSISWLPDGRIVYLDYKSQSNTPAANLWEIKVDPKTGKGTNPPHRVTSWPDSPDFHAISVTRDGKRIVLLKGSFTSSVYVGELDSKGALRTPRRLTLEDSKDFVWDWTPDSRAVIFTSDRSGTPLTYKQAIDQTDAEPITTGPEDNSYGAVSPDGRWILYEMFPRNSHDTCLMRIPMAGGPPQLVLRLHHGAILHCARSARCLVVEYLPDKQLRFISVDPATASSRELFRHKSDYGVRGMGGVAISPEGSEIAVMSSNFHSAEIELLSISGQRKQLVNIEGWSPLCSLDYTADAKAFYAGFCLERASTLLRVDRSGRAEPVWQRVGGGMSAIASPDGHYLALTVTSYSANAWMLEGF